MKQLIILSLGSLAIIAALAMPTIVYAQSCLFELEALDPYRVLGTLVTPQQSVIYFGDCESSAKELNERYLKAASRRGPTLGEDDVQLTVDCGLVFSSRYAVSRCIATQRAGR